MGLLGLEQVVEREHHEGSLGILILPVGTKIGLFFFFSGHVLGVGRGSPILWNSLARDRSLRIMSQSFFFFFLNDR